jgi:hypothetical protein
VALALSAGAALLAALDVLAAVGQAQASPGQASLDVHLRQPLAGEGVRSRRSLADQLVEQSLQGLQLLGAQLLHVLLEALGQRHGPPFLGNNILA